jgi:DUF1365 family protein
MTMTTGLVFEHGWHAIFHAFHWDGSWRAIDIEVVKTMAGTHHYHIIIPLT